MFKKKDGTNTLTENYPVERGRGSEQQKSAEFQEKQPVKSKNLEILWIQVLKSTLPLLWVYRIVIFLGVGKFYKGYASPIVKNQVWKHFKLIFTLITIGVFAYLYLIVYAANAKTFPFEFKLSTYTFQLLLGLYFGWKIAKKFNSAKRRLAILWFIVIYAGMFTILKLFVHIPAVIRFGSTGSVWEQYNFFFMYFALCNYLLNLFCELKMQIPDYTALTFSNDTLSYEKLRPSSNGNILLGVTGKLQMQIPLYAVQSKKQIIVAGDLNSGANRFFTNWLPVACSYTPNMIIVFCDASKRSALDFPAYYNYSASDLLEYQKMLNFGRKDKLLKMAQALLYKDRWRKIRQLSGKKYCSGNITDLSQINQDLAAVFTAMRPAVGIVMANTPAQIAHVLTTIHRQFFLSVSQKRAIPFNPRSLQFAIFLDDVTTNHLIYKEGIYEALKNLPFSRMLKDGKSHGINIFLRMPPDQRPSTIPSETIPYLDCISFWYRHNVETEVQKTKTPIIESSPVLTYQGMPVGEYLDVFAYHYSGQDLRLKAPVVSDFTANQIIQHNFIHLNKNKALLQEWIDLLSDPELAHDEAITERQEMFNQTTDGSLIINRHALRQANSGNTWE